MKDAGVAAGVNVLRIINEPTCVSLANGVNRKVETVNVLVFDLGGTTTTATVQEIDDGVFEILATADDLNLGGNDFDARLVAHCATEFRTKHGRDVTASPRAMARLRHWCERAKCALSETASYVLEVDSLFEGIDFSTVITRELFEELCADLFRLALAPIEKCLRASKRDAGSIDQVLLSGGSCRIPRVQSLVQELFGGKVPEVRIDPGEVVAVGAAVMAAELTAENCGYLFF